ncbi:MAG: hypothetical protein U0457_16745 [Candidatus Sericytochromatia bacterium]
MEDFTFIHPKNYFSSWMVSNENINPDYLGKYAKSSALALLKSKTPVNAVISLYDELYNYYQGEKQYNSLQDIADIMRSRVYSEPYIYLKFLVQIVDIGLLVVETEDEMEVFFIHMTKIIDYMKKLGNNNLEILEF